MASGGKGQEENAYKKAADDATAKADVPDEFEQRERERLTKLDDWRSGRLGPVDVRNMPGGEVPISLFNEAKKSNDAGRIGRGLGTLSDGANPNFAAALDKENQLERDLQASGQLEGNVEGMLGDLDARMMGLSASSDARKMNLAQMAQQRYVNYHQTKQPSFLRQAAVGLIGSAGKGLLSIGSPSAVLSSARPKSAADFQNFFNV